MQAIVLLFLNPLILSASSPISPLVYYLSLNLCQNVLKDLIVMLHTIVQINLNHLIRQRVNFFPHTDAAQCPAPALCSVA